jgi:uncharacterized protein (TIGR02466 family)
MLQRTEWFSTPIWATVLDRDLSSVRDEILRMEKTVKGVVVSNRGGYQTKTILDKLDTNSDFKEVFDDITENVKEAIRSLDLENKNSSFTLSGAWANVNRRGSYNQQHVHSKAFLVGVLYVAAPKDCGAIKFHRPDLMTHYTSIVAKDPIFYTWGSFEPKNNLLLIFPAWIGHEVEESQTDAPRISIAFNFSEVK